MSVNVLQTHIYNCFLSSLAKANNRPFTRRKNFENLDADKITHLQKLEKFFVKHNHINIAIFMDAPYMVYSDKKYYGLDFFTKNIALNTYFLYLNLLDAKSPDSSENLSIIKDSILFIKDFCIKNKISLMEYLNFSESVTFSWCNHLLNQSISIYNVLAFSYFNINIYMLINQLPPDEKELFLHQYNDNISQYIKKLNDSKKAKVLLINGYKKIGEIINDTLKNESRCDILSKEDQ